MIILLAGVAGISGCKTPYGDRLAIEYGQPQIGGFITVSDPKLYRREALINERRREVSYIEQLMARTEKPEFVIAPDIAREVEVIRALSVTVGLSFDPALGVGNRQAQETGSIRQEIDALQLQLQLDQLRRDATLFRERLAEQASVSRDGLGTPTTDSSGVPAASLTPADTADLVARIESLQTTLAGRLGATIAGPRGVTMAGNPIDQFRDRAAYLQVLTTARNAAGLDELHDLDGAALYRMTFQVTTLPPGREYLRSAGVVEMRPVQRTRPDSVEIEDVYLRWLGYINQSMSFDGGNPVDSFLLASHLFSRIDFQYDPGSSRPIATGTGEPRRVERKALQTPPVSCPGLVSSAFSEKVPPAGCSLISFVAPDLAPNSASYANVSRTMGHVVDRDLRRMEDQSSYDAALALFRRADVRASLLVPGKCELQPVAQRRLLQRGSPGQEADTAAGAAMATLIAVPLLAQTIDRMAHQARSPALGTALNKERARLVHAASRARSMIQELSEEQCTDGAQLNSLQDIAVPARFKSIVDQETTVRVYEVGPREQVQQASTAARAADAFSLAAALSAQVPTAGAAARAGVGYSRNAAGKADVIERLPLVVGYAQAGGKWDGQPGTEQPRFGWLLGPRVNSVDPRRGKLELEQGQKVYDLSADLSVSGWRTRLPVEVRTAWSPKWHSPAFKGAMDVGGAPHLVQVELNPSPAEFAQLTQRLGYGPVGRGLRVASVDRLTPRKIKACMAATIVVRGDNLWRATEVVVGGQRIRGDAVEVLPDMRGLTIDLSAKTSFPDISDQKVDIQILTPYGVAQAEAALTIDGYDTKGCDRAEVAGDGPSVAAVSPEVANICSAPVFELTGNGLDMLTRVRFGAADGTLSAVGTKAKLRKVSFTRDQLATVGTEIATMQFFAGDKAAGAGRVVRLVERNCGGKE